MIFIRFNCEHFYTSIPRKYVIPRRHSEVLPTTEYGIYRICFLDAYLLPVRDTKRAITFWNTRSTVPISSSNGANSSPALRLQFGACVHPKTERTGTNSCPTRQRRVRQASRTSSERADRETNVESWNVKGRHSIHSSFGDASGTDERFNVCFRQEMTSNNEAGHANRRQICWNLIWGTVANVPLYGRTSSCFWKKAFLVDVITQRQKKTVDMNRFFFPLMLNKQC